MQNYSSPTPQSTNQPNTTVSSPEAPAPQQATNHKVHRFLCRRLIYNSIILGTPFVIAFVILLFFLSDKFTLTYIIDALAIGAIFLPFLVLIPIPLIFGLFGIAIVSILSVPIVAIILAKNTINATKYIQKYQNSPELSKLTRYNFTIVIIQVVVYLTIFFLWASIHSLKTF